MRRRKVTHSSRQLLAVVFGSVCSVVVAKPIEQVTVLELVFIIDWIGKKVVTPSLTPPPLSPPLFLLSPLLISLSILPHPIPLSLPSFSLSPSPPSPLLLSLLPRGGHSSANAPIVALTSCCVALNTNSN